MMLFIFENPDLVYKRRIRLYRMGGSKNKSPAQKQRSQDRKKPDPKKAKKGDKPEGGAPKAEIRVVLTEQQASRALKNAKVITVHELARQTGVKMSAANAFLRAAVRDKTVRRVAGTSGHAVYQPVSE